MPLSEVCFERGKPAQTQMEVMSRGYKSEIGDWTRVRLFPKTGRSHQLRVHMKYIGHPILGDRFYGGLLLSKTGEGRFIHCICMLKITDSTSLSQRHPNSIDTRTIRNVFRQHRKMSYIWARRVYVAFCFFGVTSFRSRSHTCIYGARCFARLALWT